jgi:hypothetical protein
MQSERAIAVVIFLILLAISVVGYFISSRNGDRLDRMRHAGMTPRERESVFDTPRA